MTFKAKPVVKRAQRPSLDSHARRNLYLNVGFGLVTVTAVVILLVAAGLSWYNDHLASVGSVNGQSISKDDFADRYAIESWRLDQVEQAIRTDVAAGHLTDTDGAEPAQLGRPGTPDAHQRHARAPDRQPAPGQPRDRGGHHRDARRHRRAAPQGGDHPRDAPRLGHRGQARDRRRQRRRRPTPRRPRPRPRPTRRSRTSRPARPGRRSPSRSRPTRPRRRNRATSAGSGRPTRSSTRRSRRRSSPPRSTPRPTWSREPTGSTGSVGSPRSRPSPSITEYQSKLTTAGIDLAKYRLVVQGDVIRQKLEDKVVAAVDRARATAARPGDLHQGAVRDSRAPTRSRSATSSTRPRTTRAARPRSIANDPAWKAAEDEADADLQEAPGRPEPVRLDRPDARATRPATWAIPAPAASCRTSIRPARSMRRSWPPSWPPGLQPGQLLPPVKSAFGWHVIQVMYRPPDIDWLNSLKTKADGGADFATLARDNSEAHHGRRRRRPRLDRQGPARRALRNGDLRDGASGRPRASSSSPATGSTCSRCWPRRPGRRRARSSTRSSRPPSPTGTRPRRTRRPSPGIRPSRARRG